MPRPTSAEGAAHRADLAFFAAILAGVLFLTLLGPLGRRLELVHDNDFSGFWAGGRALVTGRDPYDASTWRATTVALGTQTPDTPVYGYPPWVALAFVPLALLPLETAAWLWMIAGLAAAVTALRALLRACLPGRPAAHATAGLALLGSQPAFHAVVLGQWSPLLLAATATGVLLVRHGRGGAAGATLLALVAKPQLALGAAFGIAVAARRDVAARHALVAGGIGATALAAAATLAVPAWWQAWSAMVAPQRLERSASLASALGDLVGPAGSPLALALVAVGGALALGLRADRDASLAAWLALSIAGAPYLWSYDHLLLLVPLVLGASALARRDAAAATRLVVAGSLVLLVASPVLYGLGVLRHRESFSAIVPFAFFVAIVATCRPGHDA